MSKRYLILDCFVDEPACFGVPPFVSPYPRYIYGALVDAGIVESSIEYLTIDDLRATAFLLEKDYDMVFLVGGAVVPGKYIGQQIGTIDEIRTIFVKNSSLFFAAGALAARHFGSEDFSHVVFVLNDLEKFAYTYVRSHPEDMLRDYEELNRWARIGAHVVRHHPDFPDVICEIETYRGCPRTSHCLFCSEGLFGECEYRDQEDILSEVDSLIDSGVSRFRLGRQADILAYKCHGDVVEHSFPKPCRDEVIPLFEALGERRRAGKIEVLNVDNANPGTVAYFQNESFDILRKIAEAVSPGDTLPLGIESFDPAVIAQNNLKVDRAMAIDVVRIMNEAGGFREDGLPKLLPGINLIHGLNGESNNTFKINYEALRAILDEGLLLKRINIRSLLPFPGTPLAESNGANKHVNRYRFYRKKIRDEIDAAMLKSIYPYGTSLKKVKISEKRNGISYGRQIASYAITVKIRGEFDKGTIHDIAVVGHEERSIGGIPIPLNINRADEKQVGALPGVGRKSASSIILERPFGEVGELLRVAPSIDERILPYLVTEDEKK